MKKIIIIGGGIAGLSAGIYAKKAGFDVEIYEKNIVAGGQCTGWYRKDHHIDNCIHWLTGTKKGTSLRKLWEDIGALNPNSEFIKSEKFYTTYLGNLSLTIWRDLERTRNEMIKLSPEDEVEINKFIEYVEYASSCEMPVEKPMDMMNLFDYIKLGKDMANMPKVIKEYGKVNLEDVAGRFHHPILKTLFTDYLPKEYQASSYIISYATVVSGNGEIPVGGSLSMTNRIIKRYEDLGGKLYCNCAVKRLIMNDKCATGIQLENGDVVKANYVVCATDTMEMFENLIGKEYMDRKWKTCYENQGNYPLFSGFQMAFSIEKSVYTNSDTIIFDCEPFEINGRKIERISVKSYEYEEVFSPEGKVVLQANIAQFDHDYKYWRSLTKAEYSAKKQELAEIIKNRIIIKFVELEGKIELLDCWTPVTYERYCNSYHGAYMSFITKKEIKSFHVKGVVKGISNFYIASQWIQAPGGLPVAAAAGKFAIQRILKKEKKVYMF